MAQLQNILQKSGGRSGIQHVALNVDNIEEAIAEMKEKMAFV